MNHMVIVDIQGDDKRVTAIQVTHESGTIVLSEHQMSSRLRSAVLAFMNVVNEELKNVDQHQ